MLKSLTKIFNKRTDYEKLKKEIAPVPPKFINALMDSINLGLIDKTQSFLSDLSSGEIANIIEQLDAGDRKKLIFFLGSSIEPEIILELDKEIRNEIISAHSATFKEYWGSTDYTLGYFTSSFVINSNPRSALDSSPGRLFVNITNIESRYLKTDVVKFRVFVENIARPIKFKRLPLETKSEIYSQMYYRVRDFETGDVIIPFETSSNATLLSTDTDGMYFEFYMDSLPRGRTYIFDFLIKKNGFDTIITDAASKFRVN